MKIKIFSKALMLVGLLILVSLLSASCNAQTYEDYAPIFYFEKDEKHYPADASNYIDNSELKTLLDSDIQYYDNINGITNDVKIVYYRTGSEEGSTFVQYWLFYEFNDGEHNQHEGDWEMVQVVIPSSGEKWVAYSQHYSGQKATWGQVEKEGNHIKVYVARGSHANYLRSFSGKLGIAGDIVGSNGKTLKPNDYELVELTSQDWIDFEGLWGKINSLDDFLTGSAGPQGPQYRTDMNGNLMWNGVSWGNALMQANDTLFTLEWFLYNFITILIVISFILLAIILFRIYLRHKKYGLGPRIVSMLYIDGLDLKSIGNILCIVAIIIAIIGLFNPWYVVSADVNVEGFVKTDTIEVLRLDGINGVQINMPTEKGPAPMGTVYFPFSFIILIGFVFMILATVGIHLSSKLGRKYLYRGIRLTVIIIVIIVAIMSIGMMAGSGNGNDISSLLNEISSNPMGGSYDFTVVQEEVTGNINLDWGIGLGAILILLSGIILIISGILEIIAKKTLFEPKIPIEKTKKSTKKSPEESQEAKTEETNPPNK
ncbi:MAG TPA: hypothetical protein ENN45_01675 [Bacteroidetes bacterium]|nr:hypothetical protein [Bacteroidota bacterium]